MQLPEIEAFALQYGFKPRLTKPEFKRLPERLRDGETLHAMCEGWADKRKGQGILVATDKRVFFYRRNFVGQEIFEEIPISKINGCQVKTNIIAGRVIISTAGSDLELEQVVNEEARKFGDAVSRLIGG